MTRQPRVSRPQFHSNLVDLPADETGTPLYGRGDLVSMRLDWLLPHVDKSSGAIWIRIERCDHRQRVVIGTIESEPVGLHKALSHGAKLAISYDLVLKSVLVAG